MSSLFDPSPAISTPPCWICNDRGNSGEHKTKRSDLKAAFGEPTQKNPLYFHNEKRKNQLVRSLDAKILKSPGRICQYCNSTRTQPHDLAWQSFSEYVRVAKPTLKAGTAVRANRIFPQCTRRNMLNVHQFFVKQFGCLILEGKLPADIGGFASAILNDRAHPQMFLKFVIPSNAAEAPVGRSDVWVSPLNNDGRSNFISWIYELPHVQVLVMFAAAGERRAGLVGAWHPSVGSRRITLTAFSSAD
jgi:hypothetical protein